MSEMKPFDKGEIVFYKAEDGKTAVEVHLADETVWLSLNQLTALFQRDKSVISRHLQNIYESGELVKRATVAKNATVQIEGRRKVERLVDFYNLDAIINLSKIVLT